MIENNSSINMTRIDADCIKCRVKFDTVLLTQITYQYAKIVLAKPVSY